MNKIKKLLMILRSSFYLSSLVKGTAASVEQADFLNSYEWNSIIDIGANRGQFALAARYCHPSANIFSFEPLKEPAVIYTRVFAKDKNSSLYPYAIGPVKETTEIHLSSRDDSSSLLPITSTQNDLYPGTAECGVLEIQVVPLDEVLSVEDLKSPALLKLDVQGFELEALKGCETLISNFSHIYVECSFIELYEGQALAYEVIDFLSDKGFYMQGIYNVSYDKKGMAIQADFLFVSKA